jgi:internalin A
MPDSPLRSLGPITSLPALREISIIPGKLHVVTELAALTTLERLALGGSKVGELEPLAALRACEHLTLSATRTTRLDPLASLPRLRSLTIEGGDLRKISGLETLTKLEQLALIKLANVDLAALTRLDCLHTLTLEPGGARPRSLDSLASMPALRRLSIPAELFAELWAPHRLLATVEVLELTGERLPELARVAKLARLRRLLLPNRDPVDIEALADALPEVAILAELAPRDRLDRRDPFDWRSVDWPAAS